MKFRKYSLEHAKKCYELRKQGFSYPIITIRLALSSISQARRLCKLYCALSGETDK